MPYEVEAVAPDHTPVSESTYLARRKNNQIIRKAYDPTKKVEPTAKWTSRTQSESTSEEPTEDFSR